MVFGHLGNVCVFYFTGVRPTTVGFRTFGVHDFGDLFLFFPCIVGFVYGILRLSQSTDGRQSKDAVSVFGGGVLIFLRFFLRRLAWFCYIRIIMKVLVACEFSGVVRRAFRLKGHDTWSCDLLASDDQSDFHWRGHVEDYLNEDWWDLMIAHPPCTHLASSGARWFKEKRVKQATALEFVRLLLDAPIHRIALENPVSVISTRIRKPDQIIQPWQFGHGETKATCLWLKNLPLLKPTDVVEARHNRIHKLSALRGPGSSRNRQKNRSITYEGIAAAMADQWG